MSLSTQTQPYVLIGNIADLPDPASAPQGYLYHSVDTGECLILVIDPATGIRSWQPFCGIPGITGVQGPAVLKWDGGGAAGATGFVIADDVAGQSIFATSIVPAYPLFRARTAMNFTINLYQHTLGNIIVVSLLVNGAVALTHTFSALTPNPAPIVVVPGPFSIPANSTIDVKISSPNGTGGEADASVTLELF